MLEIDGAQQSGSGTIVRYAVALSALLGRAVRIKNARARRPKPGLRPQHLAAVRACAELCGARTEGLAVGASTFTFEPVGPLRGGSFEWDIGTAGSTSMLALGVLPLACRAEAPLRARITGGVFQDFAPSPWHLSHVLAPLLERMGVQVELEVVRAGYVPTGEGVIELRVVPAPGPLTALALSDQGSLRRVSGVAFSSHLEERRVSERMASVCQARLRERGLECEIERVYDTRASHPGACLCVWSASSTGARLGADRAGALRRSSEAIGRFVAGHLLADLGTGATVDRHAADQLVLFAALAAGQSRWLAPRLTEHLTTNLWLVERFGAKVERDGCAIRVQGLGR
jgi:RNA 3'-terminal phosphate cyclase (ATP)